MTENLDQLREIAQNATPGPWSADVGVRGDCVVFGPNGRFLLNAQAEPHWLEYPGETRSVAFDVDRRDCTHIATFDPSTVLALIDRVEAAERDSYGLRKGYEILNSALISQGERLEAAEAELERIRPLFENYSREYPIECNKRVAAEAAVQRVRELASEYRKTIPEEVLHSVMVDICRTLDGGEQE